MPRQLRPLFLAKRVYRRRRLRDAARLVPVLGIVLLMLPLLWDSDDGSGSDRMMIYVFAVWALLIGLAAYLSPGLARPENDEPALEPKGPDDAV